MKKVQFNQKAFIKEIFAFISKNEGMTVREFCRRAKCSPMTLYKAADRDVELRISTIERFQKVMDDYFREIY